MARFTFVDLSLIDDQLNLFDIHTQNCHMPDYPTESIAFLHPGTIETACLYFKNVALFKHDSQGV